MKERIVLAYAGGLQAAAAIPWLAEAYGAEVVTLTLDLGQGCDLEEIRDLALAAGAVRAHVLDVREAFARDFVLPALQAGALYEGREPMAAALGWPLTAKTLMEVAAIEQATAIAHGCTGVDRDRMNASVRALNPDIRVIAVTRAAVPPQGTYANLWGRAYTTKSQIPNPNSQTPNPKSQIPNSTARSAEPEAQRPSPSAQSPEPAAQSPRPAETPDTPAHVEIAFERGVPAAISGVPMALTELIESLSIIAGQHGVGRISVEESVEEPAGRSDMAGARMHRVCEAPAALVLHAAHAALESCVLPRELARLKRDRATEYAHLVWSGLWFTPAREAMDAFNTETQEHVTGSVLIRLFKGTLLASEAVELGAELGADLDADPNDAAVPRR